MFGSGDSYQAVCVKKWYQQRAELFPCELLSSLKQSKLPVSHSTVQTLGIVYSHNYLHFYQMAGVFLTWKKKKNKNIFLNSATPACIKKNWTCAVPLFNNMVMEINRINTVMCW